MMEYHKIQTVWRRDPHTKYKTLIEGAWARPDFEYLAGCPWVFTEKVDGTNIRIGVQDDGVKIGGRTDNAQIPAFLLEVLEEVGRRAILAGLSGLTLYGEGYGARIQKGGGNYFPDGVDFVLFDVRSEAVWLERDNVEDIARKSGIPVVPILGRGTLMEAINEARDGFDSRWGSFPAEGLVMRPAVEMLDRQHRRVISKIKLRDFA